MQVFFFNDASSMFNNMKQFFTGMHNIEFHGRDKLPQSIPGSSLLKEQK